MVSGRRRFGGKISVISTFGIELLKSSVVMLSEQISEAGCRVLRKCAAETLGQGALL